MGRTSLSRLVIDRSPDLARLREDGYEIQVHPANYVVVRNVPYVNAQGAVAYGELFVPIAEIGDNGVGRPPNHQAYFRGTFPHKKAGEPLTVIGQNQPAEHNLADGIQAQFYFSYKSDKIGTDARYADYHAHVTEYVEIMWRYARRIDDTVTPLTGRVDDYGEEPSVFAYRDTASTRAEIVPITAKLEGHTVAIVGLGGTGSYILDFLAKAPLKEIRLFDGDRFSQHNAFRAPGAASKEDVFAQPPIAKVDYLKRIYSELHLNISAYPYYVTDVGAELAGADFIFLCIDKPSAKMPIIEKLIELDKPFIDVGMGVIQAEGTLGGSLRSTFSAPEHRTHRYAIPTADVDDEYRTNIQIVELNALNAAYAVVRWKKHLGFYRSHKLEFSSKYTIDLNRIDNADYDEA
jgi:hypothetical protein